MSSKKPVRNALATQENLARLVRGQTLADRGMPDEGFIEIYRAYRYFADSNDIYNQLQTLNHLIHITLAQSPEEQKWKTRREECFEEYLPRLHALVEGCLAQFEKLSSTDRSVLYKSTNLLGNIFSWNKQYNIALKWLNHSFNILESLGLFGTAILLDSGFRDIYEATNDKTSLEAHRQKIISTAQRIEPDREQVPWHRISTILRQYTSSSYSDSENIKTKRDCLDQAHKAMTSQEPEVISAISLLEKGQNLIDRQDPEDIDIDLLTKLAQVYYRNGNAEKAREVEKDLQIIQDVLQARDFFLLANYYKSNGGDYVWALEVAASVGTDNEFRSKAVAELNNESLTISENIEPEQDNFEDASLKKELLTKPSSTFESEDCYLLLQFLERELRKLIVGELSKLTPHSFRWWRQRIPPDVRTNAQSRKQEREKPHPGRVHQDLDVSEYLDFSDYEKIILMKINWDEVFQSVFLRQDIITVKMGEIRVYRNDIAHMRELPLQDREAFVTNARTLLRAITQHQDVSLLTIETEDSSEGEEVNSENAS